MARLVPSRQALRYLQRLCADHPPSPTPLAPRICATIHSRSHRQSSYQRAFTTSRKLAQTPSPSSSETTSPNPSTSPLPTSLPDITTYYTLFPTTLPSGPPPASPFSISLPTLRREFLHLQSQFHPDKFSTSTPAHQKALALSSLINNAYRTLSDPLLRAQYLLQHLYDIDVMSEDNSEYSTDQATLMDVMEAQESVEEAQNQDEVDRLKAENQVRIDETVLKMSEAFERNDKDEAIRECVRLKYWRSLQQGLNDWEPGKEVRLIH